MRVWDLHQQSLDDQPVRDWIWRAFYNGQQIAEARRVFRGKDPFIATVDNARMVLRRLHEVGAVIPQDVFVFRVIVRDSHQDSWAGYIVDVRESSPEGGYQLKPRKGVGDRGRRERHQSA